MALPENIRPRWGALTQRLQGVACRQNGFAFITIQILVDASGDPVYWLEPTLTKIEPINASSQFINEMMRQALNHRE
jgi:hypothetical protein